MILFFLTAIITVAVAAPGLSQRTPIVIDSTEGCQFHVGSRQYNLCPIFERTAAQLPSLERAEFRVHFEFDDGDPVDYHCFHGTRICELEAAENPSETPRPIGSSITIYWEESDGGGERTSEVHLICDPQIQLGEPVFSGVENALHHFTWRTKHACEVSDSSFDALNAESDIPPSDDNSEPSEPSETNEGEEQLLDGDRQRQLRRSTAIVFAIIFIIILSLSIISYKHHDHLNVLFSAHIKPIFHRLSLDNFPRFSLPHSLKPAGESRLMRWAHEDLELDEDMMVNGSDAYDEPEDAGDEYIPLRPSPRKGGRSVKNYGTATSPFW